MAESTLLGSQRQRHLLFNILSPVKVFAITVKMPDIEMPDPEELGGNVTKPFKFVTGTTLRCAQTWSSTNLLQLVRNPAGREATFADVGFCRLRCPLPKPEPNKALLAKLRWLPQMHSCQRGGISTVPPGMRVVNGQFAILRPHGAGSQSLALQFFLAYRSLCPKSWTERWDGQRGMLGLHRWWWV